MNSAAEIRNRVIDQIMAIKDTSYLKALSDMIGHSHVEEVISFTEEQKAMLLMSEDDIKTNKVIEQDALNERELQWLKGK